MSDTFMGAEPPHVQNSSRANTGIIPNITSFNFEGAPFRTALLRGSAAFVAADACAILDLGNVSMAVAKLDDDEKGISSVDTLGGAQDMLVLTEGGLYTLILRCRDATTPGTVPHRFRKWVTGEVLPTIRKTGAYGVAAIQPAKPTPRLRAQSPDAQFRDRLRSLKAAGFSVSEAALAANRFIMEREGVDILGSAGVVLPGAPTIPPDDVPALAAPDHPNHLTVTDIGIEIGVRTGSPMSGKAVNQALKTHGFQVKGATTTTPWMPTEKGKPYAKFGDVVTKGESGRTVNALTWKWEVISELLAAMTAGQGEG